MILKTPSALIEVNARIGISFPSGGSLVYFTFEPIWQDANKTMPDKRVAKNMFFIGFEIECLFEEVKIGEKLQGTI
jgi:hypothetical protein